MKYIAIEHQFLHLIIPPLLLTRGMACVGKCFESKISKPTKLDCKQNFYCTVYYVTLNSNCEAQRASKNLKKLEEDRVRSQKIMYEWFECKFFTF